MTGRSPTPALLAAVLLAAPLPASALTGAKGSSRAPAKRSGVPVADLKRAFSVLEVEPSFEPAPDLRVRMAAGLRTAAPLVEARLDRAARVAADAPSARALGDFERARETALALERARPLFDPRDLPLADGVKARAHAGLAASTRAGALAMSRALLAERGTADLEGAMAEREAVLSFLLPGADGPARRAGFQLRDLARAAADGRRPGAVERMAFALHRDVELYLRRRSAPRTGAGFSAWRERRGLLWLRAYRHGLAETLRSRANFLEKARWLAPAAAFASLVLGQWPLLILLVVPPAAALAAWAVWRSPVPKEERLILAAVAAVATALAAVLLMPEMLVLLGPSVLLAGAVMDGKWESFLASDEPQRRMFALLRERWVYALAAVLLPVLLMTAIAQSGVSLVGLSMSAIAAGMALLVWNAPRLKELLRPSLYGRLAAGLMRGVGRALFPWGAARLLLGVALTFAIGVAAALWSVTPYEVLSYALWALLGAWALGGSWRVPWWARAAAFLAAALAALATGYVGLAWGLGLAVAAPWALNLATGLARLFLARARYDDSLRVLRREGLLSPLK